MNKWIIYHTQRNYEGHFFKNSTFIINIISSVTIPIAIVFTELWLLDHNLLFVINRSMTITDQWLLDHNQICQLNSSCRIHVSQNYMRGRRGLSHFQALSWDHSVSWKMINFLNEFILCGDHLERINMKPVVVYFLLHFRF